MNRLSDWARALGVVGILYAFLVSIGLIGAAFKLFGSSFAQEIIQFTTSPFIGLFIGILTTSLVQSSSATTSLVVGMVAGDVLTVTNAIPIIMGSNIGTSVTNTLVSLGHIGRKQEFRLAFAASTMHDFFNILAVLILFPLEYFTGFLSRASGLLGSLFQQSGGMTFANPLKMATDPAIKLIVNLAFHHPVLILFISFVLLFLSLKFLSSMLRGIFLHRAESFFAQRLFRTAGQGFLFGMVLTMLVQSSSITTSMVIPLAAAGMLSLRQIYPYTLGANVGTTITAILASLVTSAVAPVTVAFSHLLFNVFGIALIVSIKGIRHLPVSLAERLAEVACERRWVALAYILVVFFLVPMALIGMTR